MRADLTSTSGTVALTTTANSVVREVHDRTPVVLSQEGAEKWLAAPERRHVRQPAHRYVPVKEEEVEGAKQNDSVEGRLARGGHGSGSPGHRSRRLPAASNGPALGR